MSKDFVYSGPITTIDTDEGPLTFHAGKTYALDDGHPAVAGMIARELLKAAPAVKKTIRKGKS